MNDREYFFDLEMRMAMEIYRSIHLEVRNDEVFIHMSEDVATRLTVITGLTGKQLEGKVKKWILNKILNYFNYL